MAVVLPKSAGPRAAAGLHPAALRRCAEAVASGVDACQRCIGPPHSCTATLGVSQPSRCSTTSRYASAQRCGFKLQAQQQRPCGALLAKQAPQMTQQLERRCAAPPPFRGRPPPAPQAARRARQSAPAPCSRVCGKRQAYKRRCASCRRDACRQLGCCAALRATRLCAALTCKSSGGGNCATRGGLSGGGRKEGRRRDGGSCGSGKAEVGVASSAGGAGGGVHRSADVSACSAGDSASGMSAPGAAAEGRGVLCAR